MAQKRSFNEGKRHFKKNKKQKTSTVSDGSNEEVLLADIKQLLKKIKIETDIEPKLPDQWSEISLDITELSSTGDGLAEKDGQVYVVPFCTPGDTVVAKIVRHDRDHKYSLTDFVKVTKPSTDRTETPKCPHFSKCAGCQFQQLPYQYQLEHKRRVVEKAFRNFSGLEANAVPEIRQTMPSPLQYGYRTKLTPHFDGPPGGRRDRRNGQKPVWNEIPPIGFMLKGTRKTLDIEDCPIGTQAVRKGWGTEKKRVQDEIHTYQKGATLLLRESTQRLSKDAISEQNQSDDVVIEDRGEFVHQKRCITDNKAITTEYIDNWRLDNPAGAFFQNNNSILPLVTEYIRENILETKTAGDAAPNKIKNMIDAYCGSGFFTITLSQVFDRSIGIDISGQSVDFARMNAKLNNLPEESTSFIAADANKLFDSLDTEKFPAKETAVVIDPSRKGCDEGFIRQLIAYGPERICYVSCNVHTQARDVGWLVKGLEDDKEHPVPGIYEIESLRGFDFFPQTSHVEGVAILRKKRPRVEDERDEASPTVES